MRMSRRFLVALLLVGAVAVACDSAPPPSAARPPTDCADVPPDQCRAAVDDAVRNAGGVPIVSIEVRCTGACTPAEGQANVVVALADGRQLKSSFGWAPVTPAPADDVTIYPVCQELPLDKCDEIVQNAMLELQDLGRSVVRIVVRCTNMPCSATAGEGVTDITFTDGSLKTLDWSYDTEGD